MKGMLQVLVKAITSNSGAPMAYELVSHIAGEFNRYNSEQMQERDKKLRALLDSAQDRLVQQASADAKALLTKLEAMENQRDSLGEEICKLRSEAIKMGLHSGRERSGACVTGYFPFTTQAWNDAVRVIQTEVPSEPTRTTGKLVLALLAAEDEAGMRKVLSDFGLK